MVRGATATQLRALGVDRRAWLEPIGAWAVPVGVLDTLIRWARMAGRDVEDTSAELDR